MKTLPFSLPLLFVLLTSALVARAATPLSYGTTYSGSLNLPGQSHAFTFTGTPGELLYFDSQSSDSPGITLTILSPHGTVRYSGSDDFDHGPLILTEPGTYTLTIDGQGVAQGTYRFRLLNLAAAPLLTFAEAVAGQLSPSLACNIYRFEGTAGQRAQFQSLSYGTTQMDWKLITPANAVLASAQIYQNLGPVTLPLSGTYYLLINGFLAVNPPVTYQFQATLQTEPAATAAGFGVVHSGTVSANQTNRFNYTAPAGLPVFFDSQDTSGQLLVVDLRDPAGNIVFTVGQTADSGPHILPRSGDYSLEVRGPGGGSGNFRFRLLDLSTSPVLPLNTVVSNVLSAPYQTDFYQFSGTAGQRLFYDAIDSDFDDVQYWIRNPDGQTPNSGNSDQDRGPMTLATDETYYLFIRTGGTSSPNYVFQLLGIDSQPSLPLNTDLVGNLPANANLIYQLAGVAGQRLFFDGKGPGGSGAFWTLYAPNNAYAGQASMGGDFEMTLGSGGNYVLVLSGGSASINYSNQVSTFSLNTNALALGTAVTNTITKPGDGVAYTFTGAAGQKIFYDALTANFIPINVILYSPAGAAMFSGNASSDRGPLTLLSSGTYTLWFDASGDTTGLLAFQLLDVAPQPVAPLNVNFTGVLPANASALYKISSTNGQRLFFDGKGVSVGGAIWTLHGANNAVLAQAGLSGDFETTFVGSDDYLLVLSGGASTASYTNQVNTFSQTTAPLSLGIAFTNTIARPGDVVHYTFAGAAGQRIYFDTFTGSFISINASLVSPSGAVIFSGNASSDRGPFQLSASGTYTLVFDGSGDTTGELSFQLLDIDVQPILPLEVDFIGILPTNASAIYQIPATNGQRLFFDGKGVNIGGAIWTLYGLNNAAIGQAGLAGDFESTVAIGGNYTLVLSGGAAMTAHTNQVNTFRHSASALATDVPTTNAIVRPGDVLIHTFAGTAGQRLFYDALNSTFISINVTLIAPQGTVVFSGNASSDRGPLTLIENGPYTLVFDGSGDTTGTINYQLLDFASAPSVDVGGTINGSLPNPMHSRAYRFAGTAGQRVNLQSISASGSQASWQLLGPADQTIGAVMPVTSSLGTFALPVTGTYVILVTGNGASSPAVTYQLGISEISDTPVATSGFGVVRSGNIGANQTNSFSYAGSAGLPVYYDSQDISGQLLVVDLMDPAGNVVFTVNETIDAGPYILPRSGTYTVNVRSFNATGSGNYAFRLLDLSASPLLPLNAVVSNTLTNAYQTDLYRWPHPPGQRFIYDAVMEDPNFPSVNVARIDPRGQVITLNGAFSTDVGPFTAQHDGNSYLVMRNNRDSARSFAFRLLEVSTQTLLPINTLTTTNLANHFTQLYRHQGTAGQRLFFRGQTGNPSGFWTLFDPNNNAVPGSGTGLTGEFEATLPVSGTYVLALTTYAGNSGADTFQVNDFQHSTNSYTIGSVVRDFIDRPGEQKHYTFTSTVGQRLIYDALTNDVTGTANATLYNPQGQFAGGPAGASILDNGPFTLQQSGTYTLVVKGNVSRTGPFAFRILDLASQAALPINVSVQTNLENHASAVYRYAGVAGQRLYFRGQVGNPSGFWTLHDPNNATVPGSGVGLTSDFEVTLPSSGTYALVLSTYSGNAGAEIFQVNDFQHITNNYTIGSIVRDTIDRPGEQKYFRFTGTLGQRLIFDALTNDLSGGGNATLLNPQGQWSVGPNGSYFSDNGPFILPQTGIYTLVLDAFSSRTGPIGFRLIDVTDQETLPLSTPVSTNMQNHVAVVYRHTGTAGQRLYFRAQTGNPSGFWTLFDPNNATVPGSGAGLSGDFEITLPVNGIYVLVLNTSDGVSGLEGFQVNPFNAGETFAINRAPVLNFIGAQSLGEGDTLALTAIANDPDGNNLTFSLDNGAPAGATIGAESGTFSWTPAVSGFSYVTNVTIRVTDNGSPTLSAAETIAIKVISGPVIVRTLKTATNMTIFWRSAPAERYRLQYRNNFNAAQWSDVSSNDITAQGFTTSEVDASIGTNYQRYYRVLYFPDE